MENARGIGQEFREKPAEAQAPAGSFFWRKLQVLPGRPLQEGSRRPELPRRRGAEAPAAPRQARQTAGELCLEAP